MKALYMHITRKTFAYRVEKSVNENGLALSISPYSCHGLNFDHKRRLLTHGTNAPVIQINI